jgi:hypothetical protein
MLAWHGVYHHYGFCRAAAASRSALPASATLKKRGGMRDGACGYADQAERHLDHSTYDTVGV